VLEAATGAAQAVAEGGGFVRLFEAEGCHASGEVHNELLSHDGAWL
jgi:hypothetical protein